MYELSSHVVLPRSRGEVFRFFSNAGNLEVLTPRWLRFEISTPEPIDLRANTIIDYRLRWHGIPIHWRSEITVWEPPVRFVDEQRKGPYKVWVHEHRFEEREASTIAIDRVRYDHFGGRLVNRLLVAPDLETVFAFRRQKLVEIFGSAGSPGAAEVRLTSSRSSSEDTPI